jgi:hypothetical protein
VFKQSNSTILTAKETPEKIQEYIDSGCEFVKVGTKSPKGNVTEVKEEYDAEVVYSEVKSGIQYIGAMVRRQQSKSVAFVSGDGDW